MLYMRHGIVEHCAAVTVDRKRGQSALHASDLL